MDGIKFDLSTIQTQIEKVLNNEVVFSILSLLLVIYGSLAAPSLPHKITKWFDYSVVKVIIFFIIAYLATKNTTIAIITAVGVLLTLQQLSKQKMIGMVVKTVTGKTPDELTTIKKTEEKRAKNGIKEVVMETPNGTLKMLVDKDSQPIVDKSGNIIAKQVDINEDGAVSGFDGTEYASN